MLGIGNKKTSLLLSPKGESNPEPLRERKRLRFDALGFTMLEVLAALLLVAVVCGIVLPEVFRSRQNAEQNVVVRQIQTDLRQLQDEAKGIGVDGRLIFTPGVAEYRMIIGERTMERPLMGFVCAGEEPISVEVLANGEICGDVGVTIVDRNGMTHRVTMRPGGRTVENR